MHTTTIGYLGKKFDVYYEITQDHNGDDEVQIESIMFEGTEMVDFLECVYVWQRPLYGMPVLLTALEDINEIIWQKHKEPEQEYDSTQVED